MRRDSGVWTRASLHGLIDEKLRGYKFIVLSNREPYIHHYCGGRIGVETPASGMATALDPILRTSGGTWIAHGSGDADRFAVDKHDRLAVPPAGPQYTLRRVWLTKEQEEGLLLWRLECEHPAPLSRSLRTPDLQREELGPLPRGQ